MKIPRLYQLRRDCQLVSESNVLGGLAWLSIEDLGSEGEIIKDGQTVDLSLADTVMETVKQEFNADDPNSLLALLKYEVNRDNVDSIVAALKSAAEQLKEDTHTIANNLQRTLAKADFALETAESTLKVLQRFTGDERIERMLSNFAEASINVKLATRKVYQAPWLVLYKPGRKEFRIHALVNSAGAFAAGAEQLDSTALRLKQLLAETDDKQLIGRDKIKSMVSQLEASFKQYQEAEQKFWEELK
jgi:hypothetical protein